MIGTSKWKKRVDHDALNRAVNKLLERAAPQGPIDRTGRKFAGTKAVRAFQAAEGKARLSRGQTISGRATTTAGGVGGAPTASGKRR